MEVGGASRTAVGGKVATSKPKRSISSTTTHGPEFHEKLLTLVQVPTAIVSNNGKELLLTSLPVTPSVIGSLFQGLDSITNISNAALSTVCVLLEE